MDGLHLWIHLKIKSTTLTNICYIFITYYIKWYIMWYFNVHLPEATSLKNGSCKRFLIEGYDVGSLHASTEMID